MAVDTSQVLVTIDDDIDELVRQYFTNYFDKPLNVDQNEYEQVKNFFQQRTVNPSVFLYITPGSSFSGSDYQLKFYYLARIEDAGAYTNTADVAYRFIPCMVSGLAYYLSIKHSPERTEGLRLLYEDELKRALDEDGQRTSLYISPQTFFGDGV